MIFKGINKVFSRHIKNLPGWSTLRRIVVIESDDWGSIRMPSRSIYHRLLNGGLDLNGGDGLRFCLYDSLETASDLALLFEILNSYRDYHHTSAIFTPVSIVANPDFRKIKESGFQHYYYEPFTETLKNYQGNEGTFELYKEGITNGIFMPQFHGREHLNVSLWMNALRAKDSETAMAFNEGVWAFIPRNNIRKGLEFEAAFQLSELSKLEEHIEIIRDGLDLFEKVFGYRAEYFVPPNGRVNNKLNFTCYKNGVKFRSASYIQEETNENGKDKTVLHWLGQKESNGMRYIVRNCVFEPSIKGKDWVDYCLKDIKAAFSCFKPAIITTHRVNFISAHDVSNRDNGLKELSRLLKTVTKKWPDVEFMATNQLGDLIEDKR